MKLGMGLFARVLLIAAAAGLAAPALADANTAYLERNKQRSDVEVTDTGLQYKVLREGTGEQPGPTDMVRVHYRGRLVDGTVFDSSYKRGQPAKFRLNGVIPGWQEGVQLMREGAKYELVIPARLAYGSKGAGDVIPPGATLIFEVELLEVVG
ncbi:MAG: FKBP-type peptidyl-prolyl cis-trans isomerase [Alphaproteobacteria bacterium]